MIKVTYIDHMGSDLSVVNAARVSFGNSPTGCQGTQRREECPTGKDRKLIQYLAAHRHTGPFGHCFASFHIVAPVFVARQLVKHKFLRWNEVSRRYVDDDLEFFKPRYWRGRSADRSKGQRVR